MIFASAPTPTWQLLAGSLLVFLAVVAVYRRVEVRLTLLLAALALAGLAGNPWVVVHKFFGTFADEKFVVPLCTAMGFAYVIRHTGCDQHLVHLLVKPLTRVRWLLVPGTVVVGFLVNMPIVSQTSTAITIGSVVIPILLAARLSPVTTGAALLLGSSIGGELFNPGAPELRTTIVESQKAARALDLPFEQYNTERCVERLLPLNLLGLVVATGVFWYMALRLEARRTRDEPAAETPPPADDFKVNLVKAMIPLVPLVLLYVTAPPFQFLQVPFEWLEDLPRGRAPAGRFESRLIGLAMVIGAAVAGLVVWRKGLEIASVFCEGAGYGFANIVSLIVAANCFGEAIKEARLAEAFGGLIQHDPALLLAAAGAVSVAFAFLCGSGMATAQSLFVFFAEPALRLNLDPAHVGAVVSLGAAAGRTMSPVSAVALMTARLTDTNSFQLSRRVAGPLLAGMTAIVIAAILRQPEP
jgi:DcuC family C4-dicarboxylate transporter